MNVNVYILEIGISFIHEYVASHFLESFIVECISVFVWA